MRKNRIIASAVTAEAILSQITDQADGRDAIDDLLWLLADMAVRNPRQFLQSAERLQARKAAGRA